MELKYSATNAAFWGASVYIMFCSLGFIFGLLDGFIISEGGECEYKSIISRINPGYVVGCELSEPRFAEAHTTTVTAEVPWNSTNISTTPSRGGIKTHVRIEI